MSDNVKVELRDTRVDSYASYVYGKETSNSLHLRRYWPNDLLTRF
jgi:hypothetical protein